MFKKITGAMLLAILAQISWADESAQYDQKTLPNGDVVVSFSSSDGSKVVSVQHKNGEVETTSTTADGAVSVTKQHMDGSSETHVTTPKKVETTNAKE